MDTNEENKRRISPPTVARSTYDSAVRKLPKASFAKQNRRYTPSPRCAAICLLLFLVMIYSTVNGEWRIKMKSLIISLIIGALIVWGSIEYTSGLEKISGQLVSDSQEVRRFIEDENFEEALLGVEEIGFYLEQKRAVMDATGKHNEMDEIEINLAELRTYTENGSKADALAKCASLEFLFEHLPKNFKLRIENIL